MIQISLRAIVVGLVGAVAIMALFEAISEAPQWGMFTERVYSYIGGAVATIAAGHLGVRLKF